MDNNPQFIDDARVFVNPAFGCDSACSFCYLDSLGFTRLEPSTKSGEDIKKSLLANPQFIPGKTGTIISLSPDTESFAERIVPITLDYIRSLSKLQNPMQIATKRQLDKTLANQIIGSLAYPDQLTVFVSSSSITYHHVFEKQTAAPTKRFETFSACRSAGLPVCLFIKPVIPNITIIDVEKYVTVINEYSVPYCCIGEFYADSRMLLRLNVILKSLGKPEIEDHVGKYTSPFSDKLYQIKDLNSDNDLTESFLQVENYIRGKTSTRLHRTSTCVVSDVLHISSVGKKWINYPHLCVKCQDCEGMSRALPASSLKIIKPVS